MFRKKWEDNNLKIRSGIMLIFTMLIVSIFPQTAYGLGEQIFKPYVNYSTGSSPEAVAIGDVNGDGKNDVVMTTSSYFNPQNDNKIFVYLQNSARGLNSPIKYSANGSPKSVAICDLNNDGKKDVVVGNGQNIEVFMQNQSGGLNPGVSYNTNNSISIKTGDFNNDGLMDVAGIGWGTNNVDIMFQKSDGSLGMPITYDVQHGGYDELEAGDVNNDGLTDIIVMSGQGYDNPNIGILYQQSNGFSQPTSYRVGQNVNTHGVAVGDINNDKLNDIVVTYGGNQPDSYIGIFNQNSQGTLDPVVSYPAYDCPESVEVIDVDNDGTKDIVALHGGWDTLSVYQPYDSDHMVVTFYDLPYASHYNPQGLALDDINSDGVADVAIADYNNGLVILYNDLTSQYGTIGNIDNPGQGQSVNSVLTVSGWALDIKGITKIEVLIDGVVQGQAIYGDPRPDVASAFPGYKNSNAGFHYSLDTRKLTNGSHTLAVRETSNDAAVTILSTKIINVTNLPAFGTLDSPTQDQKVTGTINVSGWALDGAGVTKLDVLVDGVVKGQAVYNDVRPDVANAFPAYNNQNSGFHYSLDTTSLSYGTHSITIRDTSLNGSQTNIASKTINIPGPIGNIDNPGQGQSVNSVVTVSGWALDIKGITKLEVVIDGVVQDQAIYGNPRQDVASVFPVYKNSNAGFQYSLDTRKLTNGSHTLAIRETSNDAAVTTLSTKTINVANLPAFGTLDSPTQDQKVTGTINVSGWALDGAGVTKLDVLVDGVVKGQAVYNDARPDVANAFPAYNNQNSGFHYSLDTTSLSYGTHSITIRDTSLNGSQTNIASKTINIPSPIGNIDNPGQGQSVNSVVTVSGWALDIKGITKLEVVIDGVVQGQAIYGDPRQDVASVFPVYKNSNAGFHYSLDTRKLTNGSHTLAVRETSNDAAVTILSTKTINVANLPAFGTLDSPTQDQKVTGTINVSGWALDGAGVAQLDVLVDGVVKGQAVYNDARPDVANAFPAYNNRNSGFHYSLDTTSLSLGTHSITIRDTSLNGSQTNIASKTINIP
jgi:FlaG/FlaF family flagellin (archaellin)